MTCRHLNHLRWAALGRIGRYWVAKWMALCEQAAEEQDPEKLMALVAEIDRLLAEKQQRLGKQEPSPETDA